ncbi:MAG: DUF6495 family protein [Bacteroidota bacterium]
MKYRRLNQEELQSLEAEFIRFLSANTVTGPDWEQLKAQAPEKAERLISLFSDIVFDKVLQEVKFLTFKTPKDIKVFQCLADKIVLMGMQIEGESPINFTQDQPPQELMARLMQSNARLSVYTAEKPYTKEREMELFEMMEGGCLISDGTLFAALQAVKK